ncbi:Heat shock protein-like protein [Zancudomyces culisetae]|uniref:Heat shock protein-like protein n=1 Tax=Zancudomyces culisetae TaxID=1213189 RepID=A0A1R1PUY9_ZANCU|nr:Heat shock protein-like protein [Zancudomyces culisetae]OMH84778.1 Heat shock protein-like protein [Zancudomyces culisetae]|eukprot:OMH81970.1 Heat shock protein-like protein [Zancudomyces culisetae]
MSVVGFDIGTLQSVVAVARNRGIDILTNDVSNRTTPTMVSFGSRSRNIGEMAKNLEMGNFRNTVTGLKRLIGRSVDEEGIQEEGKYFGAKIVDVDGEVGVEVDYRGERTKFSATQLYAMYLVKLKETAAKELKNKSLYTVLSVPGWYTDRQRRCVLQACEIAGLNCLRLMNDYMASALSYGITKTDLPEDKARNVVFVDMGYSTFTVAVVAFKKGESTVLSTAYSRNCGGRDLDTALVEHFKKVFGQKYKIDIDSNAKAGLRLRAGCEKLKKMLSANPVSNISVESIMEDIDVSATMRREEFEELIEPVLKRMDAPLQQALADAGVPLSDIYAVETVGGSIRVPAVKKRLSEQMQKELSFTLNQDEAVARGCAFQCAMLSPVFRVREFAVNDIAAYPITFKWDRVPEDEDVELEIFPSKNKIPSTKLSTFVRSSDFSVSAEYSSVENLIAGANPHLLDFSISKVEPNSTVKVKARLDLNGVINITSAYSVEEKEVEEVIESQTPPAEGEEPMQQTRMVRKLVKKADLPVEQTAHCYSPAQLDVYKKAEAQMFESDLQVVLAENAKNSLEEYIYDIRSKVDGKYAPFVDPSTKDSYVSLLNDTEDWVYSEEAESSSYTVFNDKLSALKQTGDLITERAVEHEKRPAKSKELRDAIYFWSDLAMSKDAKYDHISNDDRQKVCALAEKAQEWLDDASIRQKGLKLYESPVLFTYQIENELQTLARGASTIMNKPKPAPVPVPTPAAETTPSAESKTDSNANPENSKDDTTTPSEMDVD